jgi:Fur family ferric uptake transcriptional regulator
MRIRPTSTLAAIEPQRPSPSTQPPSRKETQTRQRAAIRRVLEEEQRPLTAQEIHRLAGATLPRLGLATVYRTIRRMVGEFQLVGVDFPGQPPRYELPSRIAHAHFICSACQKVFDLPQIPAQVPIDLPPGFSGQGYELIVFGHCPHCPRPTA